MDDASLLEARALIARYLKTRREELAISQAELASRTGLGIATIKRAEDARLWMNMKQFLIICDSLNLPALDRIARGVKKPRRR